MKIENGKKKCSSGFAVFDDFALVCDGKYYGPPLMKLFLVFIVFSFIMLPIADLIDQVPVLLDFSESFISYWNIIGYLLQMLLFLLILRGTNIWRYHAVEHVTAHILEDGGELTPEYYRKVDPYHIGCGSNILAFIMFLTVFGGLLGCFTNLAEIWVYSIVTMVIIISPKELKRFILRFIQKTFCLQEPTDKQIAQGIKRGVDIVLNRNGQVIRYYGLKLLVIFILSQAVSIIIWEGVKQMSL